MGFNSAFKPDKAKFYRPFDEEMRLAEQFAERALSDSGRVFSNQQRVYSSWIRLRDDDAGARAQLLSAETFGSRFEYSIREAERAIETVIEEHLSHLTTTLDPIDEIASADDPWDLIQIIAEDRTDRIRREATEVREQYPVAFARERRANMEVIEALRKLAIGSQLMALEVVDPMADVSRDLRIVNHYVKERLFTARDTVKVKVNFVFKDDENHLLYPDIPVTLGESSYGMLPDDSTLYSVPYVCHVVPDEVNDRTFIVQSKSRPKEPYTTIIKLARRNVLDRRGLRHLVVAVGEGSLWRVATREDVAAYADLCRRKFWIEDMIEEGDTSPPNPDSSSTYWSEKIMGRLLRKSRRGAENMVAPSVEHQIIPLATDASDRFAKDGTSHAAYRRRVITKYVLPDWFSWHLRNGNGGAH
jgi:hypothetical protein